MCFVFLIYINVYPLRPILRGTPLLVDIQGLEYMNDDPGAVDVLYAKIQPSPEADKWALMFGSHWFTVVAY